MSGVYKGIVGRVQSFSHHACLVVALLDCMAF